MSERTATNVDKRIGFLLRRRRLELNMSQERLAELLGVTFQQVQKYEKGVNRIAASRLFDICQTLDTSPTYFFSKPVDAREELAIGQAIAEPETMRLLTSFSAIKDRAVRKRVIDLVRALEDESSTVAKKKK